MNSDSDWSSSSDTSHSNATYTSLVSPGTVHSTLTESLSHDLPTLNFMTLLADLQTATNVTTSFYTVIRTVNCIRTHVACSGTASVNHASILSHLLAPAPITVADTDSDDVTTHPSSLKSTYTYLSAAYYKPVLAGDGYVEAVDTILTMIDSKELDEEVAQEPSADDAGMLALQEQLKASAALVEQLTNGKSGVALPPPPASTIDAPAPPAQDNDSYYFNSYSHYSIHETMLKDAVRTLAYKNAIMKNASYFKGKVVLDVGCGTGVLSYFSHAAGAKTVYGVDDSNMIKMAQTILENNNVAPDQVVLMRGKMEELTLPTKVDVVVSEWMGYGLLFETMLPSVLSARDRFMNEGGTMWPNKCSMFIEGVRDRRTEFWDDVYGIDMGVMKKEAMSSLSKDAIVEAVDPQTICSTRECMWNCDLNTVKDEELDYDCAPVITVAQPLNDDAKDFRLDALTVSFDIDFDLGLPGTEKVSFSTGCQSKTTHWYQTLLWLEPSTVPTVTAGDKVETKIRVERETLNHRDISFTVEWKVLGRAESAEKSWGKQKWTIIS